MAYVHTRVVLVLYLNWLGQRRASPCRNWLNLFSTRQEEARQAASPGLTASRLPLPLPLVYFPLCTRFGVCYLYQSTHYSLSPNIMEDLRIFIFPKKLSVFSNTYFVFNTHTRHRSLRNVVFRLKWIQKVFQIIQASKKLASTSLCCSIQSRKTKFYPKIRGWKRTATLKVCATLGPFSS